MSTSSHFGSFELAANDRLWVEPTTIYGLLNLLYDPVAWVAQRQIGEAHAVLESPYVINLEPHAGEGVIDDEQILVQGIHKTSMLTVRIGARAGHSLFTHIFKAPDFEAFERMALHEAQAAAVGSYEAAAPHFQSHVLPALYRAVHRRTTAEAVSPAESPEDLFIRYRESQYGKALDITEVKSPKGDHQLVYVHFCIWPNVNAAATVGQAHDQLLAEKQVEVALFQTCAVTDPSFLADVLNHGVHPNIAPGFGWNSAGKFVESSPGQSAQSAKFAPRASGIKLTQIGKGSALELASTPASTMPLDSACEVLVGVPGPGGTTIYFWEVVGKPYE